jgi:deferrochelatase/peroxidase EfeB
MLTHEEAQERARLIIKRMQGGILTPAEREFLLAIERRQDQQDAWLINTITRKAELCQQMKDLMELGKIVMDGGGWVG